MKKQLYIGIITLAALFLIFLIYYFVRPTKEEPKEATPKVNSTNLNIMLNEAVSSPTLSFAGDQIWSFDRNGKLFNIALNESISKDEFFLDPIPGFVSATWQPETSNFTVKQDIDGHTQYQIYDSQNFQLSLYPNNLMQPQFNSSGGIVYEWLVPEGNNELKESDLRSTDFRTVAELFRDDYEIVASPARGEVILFSSNQLDPSKIFLVDLASGKFSDLSVPLAVEGASFSPDGDSVLVAHWDEQGGETPNLYLQDLKTKNITVLGIRASIEQTVWSEDSAEIYIADTSGVKVLDILSNQVIEVAEFDQALGLEPADLLLHPNKQSLFFINKKTGFLYRVDL